MILVIKGLIIFLEVYFKIIGGRVEFFFVFDIVDILFVEKGDSGFIVFMIENSFVFDIVYVIGMVFGVFILY